MVEYRKAGEMQRRAAFVGELARREGRAAQISLSREKFWQAETALFALTAAYLAGGERQANLAVGLPLDAYRAQKDRVRRFLESVSAHVSVDGGPERYISFSSVRVYPQAIGALYAQPTLPEKGLLGVVDVGFCTTDCVLLECLPDDIVLLRSYVLSLDMAVSTAVRMFRDRFAQATGAPLSHVDAFDLWLRGAKEVSFRGRSVPVAPLAEQARAETGRAIAQAVLSAWAEKADLLDAVLLMGGGAVEFEEEFRRVFPQTRTASDPQWANALGFFRLAERELAYRHTGSFQDVEVVL